MSHGSRNPARYSRARWQTRDLRQFVVRAVGCCPKCRHHAAWYVASIQRGEYSEAERKIRVPRSLRAANEELGK